MPKRKSAISQIIRGVQKAQADRRKAALTAQLAADKAQAEIERDWRRQQETVRRQAAAEQAWG